MPRKTYESVRSLLRVAQGRRQRFFSSTFAVNEIGGILLNQDESQRQKGKARKALRRIKFGSDKRLARLAGSYLQQAGIKVVPIRSWY
jgi:hypothetical protein